jgi:PST family polysaccharide transporter
VFGYLAWTVVYAQARLARCCAVTLGVAALRLGLLGAMAPGLGVLGAAWATGLALLAESGLYLREVVRHHGVGLAALWAQAWRPLAGVAAMALGLVLLGLGWTAGPTDWAGALRALGLAVPVGAMIYAGVVAALWLLAGRPAGAEADLLAMLRRGR